MGKEEEHSIFDAAGKQPAKKPSKKSASPPSSAPVSKVGDSPLETAAAAREMLEKMQWMGDDLQKKMDQICELCGMTRKELHSYIQNSQNFPPNEWSKAQTEKTKLEQKIYSVLGIQQKKRDMETQKQQMSKERKGKTLGGRKGWIQM